MPEPVKHDLVSYVILLIIFIFASYLCLALIIDLPGIRTNFEPGSIIPIIAGIVLLPLVGGVLFIFDSFFRRKYCLQAKGGKLIFLNGIRYLQIPIFEISSFEIINMSDYKNFIIHTKGKDYEIETKMMVGGTDTCKEFFLKLGIQQKESVMTRPER